MNRREGEARARIEVPEWLQREADAHLAETRRIRRWHLARLAVLLAGTLAAGLALAQVLG